MNILVQIIIGGLLIMVFGAVLMLFILWSIKRISRVRSKRGFTDRMYIFAWTVFVLSILVSFTAVFIQGSLGIMDLSPISYIIPAEAGELAAHTGFMIWKAKRENERKYPDRSGTQINPVSLDTDFNVSDLNLPEADN